MAPFTDFRQRIAVVTGGGSGIGRELVLSLVHLGADVAVCDNDPDALESTVRRAHAIDAGVRVTAHRCDVTDQVAVERFAADVARLHVCEAVHLLFNNAGVVGGGSFVAGPREEWERVFDVSWLGVYHCTRSFLPLLMTADQGVVVNISSVNAMWASLGKGSSHSAYSAAKFAVRGFTESLIGDFRANAPHLSAVIVMPGHVRTSMPSPPRSWRRSFDSLFADYRPVSSASAAAAILAGVRNGDWRIVVGQDAEAIDERVRADPWTAYD